MDKYESKWDKKLNIITVGRDDSNEDENHFPYEPTPYSVLERLADSGYLTKNNYLVDYGCGKGRVDFYLNWKLNCKTVGIEYDSRIYKSALNNLNHYSSDKVQFILTNAEEYEVNLEADCFYFFNPFSLKILRSVIARIITSWYSKPRNIQLFFYYPSDEYICYLMSVNELEFVDEIDCGDLFNGDDICERIMIFAIK